ncbi:MAG: hypothetical protein CMH57_14355 [Myxococcales bacterium]|nr:hypothetical protein [Myxococcales bacterium]
MFRGATSRGAAPLTPTRCLRGSPSERSNNGSEPEERHHLAEDEGDWLVCASCEHPITRSAARIEVQGAHTHTFANPHGRFFQIGCFSEAPGCLELGGSTSDHTWFTGYAWSISHCRRCGAHLGWRYDALEAARTFYGVILTRVRSGG